MILAWLIAILFFGGLLAWYSERWGGLWPRWITLIALTLDTLLVLNLLAGSDVSPFTPSDVWLEQMLVEWIPRFGISLHFALDGLSLLLVALTVFLGFMAVSCSWTEIKRSESVFFTSICFGHWLAFSGFSWPWICFCFSCFGKS